MYTPRMEAESNTWPEQEALEKWRKDAGLEDLPAWFELKKAVTAHRLKVQEDLGAAKKRISEMSELLNTAQETARVQVENERDACERAVQFLLDVAEGTEEDSEKGSNDTLGALKQAMKTIQSRKDSGVRAIQEMAHGSVIGEYVQAHVNQAVEREKAKWAAVDAAWRGFWTRGGASPHVARERGEGSLVWLQEQLEAAFKVIDG